MSVSDMLQAIAAKREELDADVDQETDDQRFVKNLDPQLINLYRNVGVVLSKYRSGVIPKAFKIVPTLSNWEQILELTSPNKWTAASMYVATKLFSSNLKDDMAQRFYNILLLPRLRDEIAEYKKLNAHIYNALRRSLYKPGAFFRGIIIPLCEDPETTQREAVIISSILKKCHVPLIHSAAALLRIAEMDFTPPRGIVMMDLISKNYALPVRVIEGLVNHFVRARSLPEVPVQWHQILLKFAELYGQDLSDDHRVTLLDLIKHQTHHQVTAEVRQALNKGKTSN